MTKNLIRGGIAAILSDELDFTVRGCPGDEPTTVKRLERHKPDLLPLDLSLGRRACSTVLTTYIRR